MRIGILICALIAVESAASRGGPPPGDPIARLQQRINAHEVTLRPTEKNGYLESVLKALDVPASSQTLVFSKTSLQRASISPTTPRALYFDDETYVGFVPGGSVLEIATTDPKQGTIFYSLDQDADPSRVKFFKHTDECLQCHTSSSNDDFPTLFLRSVVPDAEGDPILSAGTTRVTQETPFHERWGGWYVTGTHGDQRHMGNGVAHDEKEAQSVSAKGMSAEHQNVTDLARYCDLTPYPNGQSDIVALMVLGHQAEMHHRMGRAGQLVEDALRDEKIIADMSKHPPEVVEGGHSASTMSRIKSAGEPLVRYMLFCDEAPLTAPVKGSSTFAKEFESRGPRGKSGRSLRDLDLNTRIFKYPCSYLIYSEQFDSLPQPLLDYVYQRLWLISHEKERGGGFDHLTTDDRDAIREILLETKPNLPGYWKQAKK